MTTVSGGARAVDFDRSGGFSIDTISKSGTNRFTGEVSYQFQNASMTAPLNDGSSVALRAGPDLDHGERRRTGASEQAFLLRLLLPARSAARQPREQLRRAAGYERTRDEGFGKVTFTPTSSVLLNFSYRGSDRTDLSDLFGPSSSATTGTGGKSNQKIGIAEGSWVINSRSLLTFKYNHYSLDDAGHARTTSPT